MGHTSVFRFVGHVEIRARGGNRRQRGAVVGAVVRQLRKEGKTVTRYHVAYSETYGFQTMTEAYYKIG